MRAIEFKGRKKNSDEWFEGNLNKISGDWYIFPEDGHNSPDYYEVEESTISQFTGLLDKNGVKIWEGDVFQDVFSDNIGIVKFGSYHHCFDDKRLVEFGSHVGFFVDFDNSLIRKDLSYWAKNREVIGSIHDQAIPQ